MYEEALGSLGQMFGRLFGRSVGRLALFNKEGYLIPTPSHAIPPRAHIQELDCSDIHFYTHVDFFPAPLSLCLSVEARFRRFKLVFFRSVPRSLLGYYNSNL